MRPPRCFVCDQDVIASESDLVHFVASDRGATWQARVEHAEPPMTGHHPDKGWFCDTHRGPAAHLAATHTIDNALALLRQETS